ncbi:MAG: hypothetical protein Q7K42_01860, partial [Candidatus Diapherotrites archaeon]|nr:hypothetical protein [Candidatus Diapherotrites archaeon]
LTEYIYQKFRTEKMPKTVHLLEFPEYNSKHTSEELEKEMQTLKELTQNLLNMREEQKLRLRWPLKELIIESKQPAIVETVQILQTTANIKKVENKNSAPKGNYYTKEFPAYKLHLNIEADAELKAEWELRELTRHIQDKRKQLKLNPGDKVELNISCSDPEFLKKFKKEIEEDTNTKISEKDGPKEKLLEREFFIELQA